MKKIDFNELKNKFVIDPSIQLDKDLDEMIIMLKINIISYSDNEEILTNLYYSMRTYFSEAVIDDVMKSCLDKVEQRDLILSFLLKK